MLVLSRKINELITIQTPNKEVITIMITDAQSGEVELSIQAPENFLILKDDPKEP